MINKTEPTQGEILRTIGARFRDYRMSMNLTREEVANSTGLSMTTLYKLESGNMTDISLGTLLKLLRFLGLYDNWEKILPELPVSPYLFNDNMNKKQRVRHSKA